MLGLSWLSPFRRPMPAPHGLSAACLGRCPSEGLPSAGQRELAALLTVAPRTGHRTVWPGLPSAPHSMPGPGVVSTGAHLCSSHHQGVRHMDRTKTVPRLQQGSPVDSSGKQPGLDSTQEREALGWGHGGGSAWQVWGSMLSGLNFHCSMHICPHVDWTEWGVLTAESRWIWKYRTCI